MEDMGYPGITEEYIRNHIRGKLSQGNKRICTATKWIDTAVAEYDDEVFIRVLYKNLLGRRSYDFENNYIAGLLALGMPRELAVYVFATSEEATHSGAERGYYLARFERYIHAELENTNWGELGDYEFIIRMFACVLRRFPKADELWNIQKGLYEGLERRSLVEIFVNSPEAERARVEPSDFAGLIAGLERSPIPDEEVAATQARPTLKKRISYIWHCIDHRWDDTAKRLAEKRDVQKQLFELEERQSQIYDMVKAVVKRIDVIGANDEWLQKQLQQFEDTNKHQSRVLDDQQRRRASKLKQEESRLKAEWKDEQAHD